MRKKVRNVTIVMGMVVVVLAGVLSGLAYYAVHRPLPKQEGEIVIPGMQDAITIYRDSWGVPHIYAATPYDLFFAQGFVHAQDRWWQMEVGRHMGYGTLSELLGQNEVVQEADRMIRTLGWKQIAEANWEMTALESRGVLSAYTAGVNAYLMDRDPGELALEYTVLNLTTEDIVVAPWSPLDSLVWAVALQWQSSGNAAHEIENAQILTRVNEEMLSLIAPRGSAPAFYVPENVDYARLPLDDALVAFDRVGPRDMLQGTAWVVSGDMTVSGKPLLAFAPGLPVQMPSPWYEIGLYCIETQAQCPYNITGLSIPGLPTIVAGHNDAIAWGSTSAWIDEQDVYIIQLNPDNPAQYLWNGVWLDMEVIEDSLVINGQEEAEPLTIYRTHLGPVIAAPSPLLKRDQALVVHWTALDFPSDPIAPLLKLNRARNWDDFRAALSQWGGAAAHVLYADVDGNIGYQLVGHHPLRAELHSGLVPVLAQDDGAAWQGTTLFDDLPSDLNPARGYLIAGNRLGGDDNFTRQIEARLSEHDAHSPDTFAIIQGDVYSPSAATILLYLLALELDNEALTDMMDWLREWDFQCTMDSPQAALFEAFWLRLIEFTYADELGALPGDTAELRQVMIALLKDTNHPWWDDVQTRFVVERRDAILRKAFEQAVSDLTRTLGSSRDTWRWGDLHTATFTSLPSSSIGATLIESQFARGPVPVSGCADSINTTPSAVYTENRFQVLSAPSARLIIDLDNLELSRAMHMTGQSSHLASPHYDDMIDPWRFIEYHTMLWDRISIQEASDAMLSLEPVYEPEETPAVEAP